MASINPYAEGKEHILFVYGTPMAFQIHFCLTIIINEEKSSELKRFLMITISHFGFRPIKKVKWRTRTNICNVWYSK